MSEQDAAGSDGTETAEEDAADSPEASAGAEDPPVDGEDGTVNADIVERVAESEPEQIAREIESLRERVESLESELETREERVEELESNLARTKADFQNYKKRMDKRREEEKQRATEDLVTRLLDVRDNLVRALEQDEDADIRDGVEATLRQFDEELDRENVETVDPEPGNEVDPQRHEVLLRVESDHPEGTVAEVHRPGYEMAGKVVRTAQVTVSEGDGESEDEAEA